MPEVPLTRLLMNGAAGFMKICRGFDARLLVRASPFSAGTTVPTQCSFSQGSELRTYSAHA
jgi:hypothetical protein